MTQDIPVLPASRPAAGGFAPGLQAPRWQPARQGRQGCWPVALRPWLLDRGSLTAKLMAFSQGEFRVRVLRQGLARPDVSERRCLGVGPGRWVLVREVILMGKGEPWVFARSLLPLSSLKGRLRQLRQLNTRPLGGFLFRQPDLEREPLEVSRLKPGQRYVSPSLQRGETLWGRRSVFRLEGRPLLVSEVFLPAFLERVSL